MARGNSILVTPQPRGVFKEGVIASGQTPKPGTIMQIDSAVTTEVGGRFTWTAVNADADGDRRLIAVLLENSLQGKLATDAYAAGERCFLYCPAAGEELNVLFGNASGTADDVAFASLLIVDDGTGKVIPTTGTPESEPFQALEAITDPTADQLIHVQYTGN